MAITRKGSLLLAAAFAGLAALVLPSTRSLAADDCAALRADFDRAVQEKSVAEAKRLDSAFYHNVVCHGQAVAVHNARIALEIALADDPSFGAAEREAWLEEAANDIYSWKAALKLGERRAAQHRYSEALDLYDKAIARSANARLTGADNELMKKLLQEEYAAKALVVAKKDSPPVKIVSRGLLMRAGMTAVPVPVPILFETDSAELTDAGKQAVDQLRDAIKDAGLSDVTLVGHTDPRGDDAYNMKLSMERVKRVIAYLSRGLDNVNFRPVAKGKREPFDVSVLSYTPTEDEVWTLDRRVEVAAPACTEGCP